MPTLSMFYGIIVYMYNEKGGKHNTPHIHAEYSGEEIVLSLDGEVLEPNSKCLKYGQTFTKKNYKPTGSYYPAEKNISVLIR